jgi:hypothetical protein
MIRLRTLGQGKGSLLRAQVADATGQERRKLPFLREKEGNMPAGDPMSRYCNGLATRYASRHGVPIGCMVYCIQVLSGGGRIPQPDRTPSTPISDRT